MDGFLRPAVSWIPSPERQCHEPDPNPNPNPPYADERRPNCRGHPSQNLSGSEVGHDTDDEDVSREAWDQSRRACQTLGDQQTFGTSSSVDFWMDRRDTSRGLVSVRRAEGCRRPKEENQRSRSVPSPAWHRGWNWSGLVKEAAV